MQFFINELQSRVRAWADAGYPDVHKQSRILLTHIAGNNFLYAPQREALQTYVYLKEVLGNKPVIDLAADIADTTPAFLKALGFSQDALDVWFDLSSEKRRERVLDKLTRVGFTDYSYPDYVLALTMGSGKTILMGLLIVYEFVLSFYHPDDARFAKNALVFGPADTAILDVLKEIKTFDYATILPCVFEDVLLNIKYWHLETTETQLNPIGNYNIVITNSSRVILRNWSETSKGNPLFALRKDPVNARLRAIQSLSNLSVFVDEAHHAYGSIVSDSLNQSRKTIHHLAEKTNLVTVVNLTGTPYVENRLLPNTVYSFTLQQGIEKGILKQVIVSNHGRREDIQSQDFVDMVVDTFWRDYGSTRIVGRLPKIAFYASDLVMLRELEVQIDRALLRNDIPLSSKLVWHSTFTGLERDTADTEFAALDTAQSAKQFVLLVNKGTEGWNCPSLVAVALYKNSTANNFVLQASCRCLRRIGDNSIKARVFLSDENYRVLDRDLKNAFNTDIAEITGRPQIEVQIDLKVEKTRSVRVKRKIPNIVSVDKAQPHDIAVSLKPAADAPVVIEREISLDPQGRAIYRDPVSLDDPPSKVVKRTFSYYEILALLQEKTHLSFNELVSVLAANGIDRDTLIAYVQQSFLGIQSIAEQILLQATKYDIQWTEFDTEIALTKADTFKISLRRTPEDPLGASSDSLVVYREDEEKRGNLSRLGFHINPYNFDSADELELFRYLRKHLEPDELVTDVYFTGGITNPAYNEFYFDYRRNTEDGWTMSRYFPDFLVETSRNRYLVIEVKGNDQRLTYEAEKARFKSAAITIDQVTSEPLMKEIGFDEFQRLNQNFEYHIAFNAKSVAVQHQAADRIRRIH